MANKNKFNFEVPGILIFIGFCVNPAIGIIMAVLRTISRNIAKEAEAASKKSGNPYYHTSMRGDSAHYGSSAKAKSKRKKSSPAYKLMVAGIIACLAFAIIGGISVELFSLSFRSMVGAFSVAVLPFLIGAGGFYLGSKVVKNRDVRFDRIRTLIGSRDSLNLTKIAVASNESLKRIRRDLQKMIDDGEFGDRAYIDLGTNNFMRTPDATPDEPEQFDYRKVYGNVFKNEAKAEKPQTKGESSAKSGEKSSDRDNFDTILCEIRRLNDDIKDDEVSDRIYKIEAHTKNIFDYVTDHPEAMPQIRTFMNYYLPTTLKLLESYSRIERVGVAGENMKKSKENIEKTLDMLVTGFEGQVDQLFKNESIDISTDISVLETMMQKDGIGTKNYDIASMLAEYTDEISDDLTDEAGGAGGAAAQKRKE
ncbi:MAG: hypothetical protein E7628_01890 [Ruminococcaceae bacterium]|nr:hypothetical protein [Oscillospiraceae bacterium]